MSNIILTLDICSLLYIILLLFVYYSKRRVKTFETNVYSILIVVAIVSIITEFIQVYFASLDYNKYATFISINCFIYIYTYFAVYLLLICFVFTKNYSLKEKNIIEVNKYYKKTLLINFIISIILAGITLVAIFLNLTKTLADTDSYYGDGIGIIFIFILATLMEIFMLISMIKYKKEISLKEKIFYISVIVLQLTSGFIRVSVPELMVNNIINTFVIAIMFFTIENPDIKLITKLKNANETKTNFLSSISNEMKIPLNTILGLSSIEEGDDWKDVNKEVNVLLDIVNNAIDSSSFDVNKIRNFKEKFNIKNSLYPIIVKTQNNITGKQILFTNNIPDIMIISNSEAIVSICDRVLSNAYKFTERGFISFNITVDNNILNINVKDSGKGISEEQLTNIFNRFNRKKEDLEGNVLGLGLGLSLVKSTVNALSGTIDIKSEIDKGTEVIITIPIEKGN